MIDVGRALLPVLATHQSRRTGEPILLRGQRQFVADFFHARFQPHHVCGELFLRRGRDFAAQDHDSVSIEIDRYIPQSGLPSHTIEAGVQSCVEFLVRNLRHVKRNFLLWADRAT